MLIVVKSVEENLNFKKQAQNSPTTTKWSLACNSNPCQNNGTCFTNNFTNTYNCKCSDGFYGLRCQYSK